MDNYCIMIKSKQQFSNEIDLLMVKLLDVEVYTEQEMILTEIVALQKERRSIYGRW